MEKLHEKAQLGRLQNSTETEQNVIEIMVRNVAQEMFLDSEETEEAVQNALDSKVSDLGDLLEMNGVQSIDEAVEKFAN